MQHIIMDTGYIAEIKIKENDLLDHFNQRSKQEEFFWQQKSIVEWIKEEERNTTFFHRSTIQHRMSNMIIRLKTEDGTILEERAYLERELLRFYKTMLTKPDVSKVEAIQ